MLLLFSKAAFSQEEGEMDAMDKLTAQKIAFFTERLQLSPKEAEVFWPIYNEYQKRRNEIIQERRSLMATYNQNQSYMTNEEIEKMVDKFIALTQEESNLAAEYHVKFKQVLPIKKVVKLYQAENLYKAFLLKQLRNRAENWRNRPAMQ
jgi:hypothetical protein